MYNILKLALVSILSVGILAGCVRVQKAITPAIVRQGVSTGVGYSVSVNPDAIPGVRIGQQVICSAANGTDISPTKLVADIQALSGQLSRESVLIINTALLLYTGVWNSYGNEAVNNVPVLKTYLEASCSGITDGLPAASGLMSAPRESSNWPIVRLPAQ